jgi:hypothetical protein
MKLKTLIVSVAVLAVLSAIMFFVRRPAAVTPADTRLGQPIVDSATVEKSAKLRVADQGKSVTLTRQPDGTWRVPGYYDFPADFSKLSGFVSSLTSAKLERLVTSNAERIARLEFKDTKVELLDAADKAVWSVTLGKTPESGTGRFLRFGDEAKAWLASLEVFLDVDPKNWVDSQLLKLKTDDIAKIEFPLPDGGTVTAAHAKKEDPWTAEKTPDGQRLKADKVASALTALVNLRFTETTDVTDANAVAARASARTFKLTTFDGKTFDVALGRKPEEKKLKAPVADSKSGPAALGSATELLNKEKEKDVKTAAGADAKIEPAKPLTPEFETIPAGPVCVFIASSDPAAPLNAMMQKRAFQIAEYTFTSLPQKTEELFEPAPPPPPPEKKADEGKGDAQK